MHDVYGKTKAYTLSEKGTDGHIDGREDPSTPNSICTLALPSVHDTAPYTVRIITVNGSTTSYNRFVRGTEAD